MITIVVLLILTAFATILAVGRHKVAILRQLYGVRLLALWIVIIVLPLYTYSILSIGTYHNILFVDSYYQSEIIRLLGSGDHWEQTKQGQFNYAGVEDHDYYLALVTSALDSIIFFSIIGIFTLIIGMRDPKNETIHSRVEYLLSADGIDPSARSIAVKEIEKMACFNDDLAVDLVVEEVNEEDQSFKISMNYRAKVVNMFRREAYCDEDFRGISIIDDYNFNYPTLGQIRHIKIDNKNVLSQVCSFSVPGRHHSEQVKIEIPPNSSVVFETLQWLWERFDSEYFVGVSRYTKNMTVHVTNSSNCSDVFVEVCQEHNGPHQNRSVCVSDAQKIGLQPILLYSGSIERYKALKLRFTYKPSD